MLLALAALVAFELASSLVGGIVGKAPAGNGPASSFSAAPAGVAAMAQLLAEHGHPVVRSTQPVADLAISGQSTLFVFDPSGWAPADTSVVGRFVRSGGHVVLAGSPPGRGLLAAMFGAASVPRWHSPSSGTAIAVGSTSVVAGVGRVSSGDAGSIVPVGTVQAVLAGSHRVFAVASPAPGGGRPAAVYLASSTPFTNAALADRDNAVLALNLAGLSSGPVVFDEYDHGYGRTGGGLAGLPTWWRWGLALALATVVVWMISAARRFGPVEPASRRLAPPRVAYADALATVLAALPEERIIDSVEPLRTEARALLCRRAGRPVAAGDAEVVAAARAAQVPDRVVIATLDRPRSNQDIVALGSALAWLEDHTGGTR
ncbi:MAG: DUF4350 domain-containing protein [Acidimicrobiales bacterium]